MVQLRKLVALSFVGLAFGWFGCSDPEDLITCAEDPTQLGCAPVGDVTPPTDVLKIGLVAPLTGNASGSGQQLRNAAYLAFDEINWTIGRYTIELVDIDSESANIDSEAIAAKYQAAIQNDGLVAGLLNWHSAVALVLMEVAADARMAHLFPLGASNAINDRYRSNPERYSVWGAKGWPQPATYVTSYLDLLQCLSTPECQEANSERPWTLNDKTVYVATEAGTWGDSFEAGAADSIEDPDGWWAANGWTVAGSLEVSADDDATTLAAKAQTIAEANVSVLLMTSTAGNIGQLVEQVRIAMDNDPMIIVEGLGWSEVSLASAGLSAIGVLDGGFGLFNGNPTVQDLVNAFKRNYEFDFGLPPSTSSGGLAYDYTRFAIEVLRRAAEKNDGIIDREKILDVYAKEVSTGLLSYDAGVVMNRYTYTSSIAPDPVYNRNTYFFPVYQYQDQNADTEIETVTVFPGGLRDGTVVFP